MDKIEAKREIKKFDFNSDGAHVALVDQAANLTEVMVMKSKDVRVEMPFEKFLTTFFYMYSDEAEILAKILGYESEDSEPETWKEYIDAQVDMVTLLKAKDGNDLTKGDLDYIEELADQIKKSQADGEKNEMKKEDVQALINKATEDIRKEYEDKMSEQSAELTKALETVESLKKEKEDREKSEFVDLVKSYSFIDEDKKESVATFLFKNRSSEGFSDIVETLEKAYKAIEVFATTEKGYGGSPQEETITEPYGGTVSKIIKERKNQ